MGARTDASIKDLLKATSIGGFLAGNQENMLTMNLSEYLMTLLHQKKLKRADVIRDSHLEHAYVYQIFDGKKKPSRDKLIAIAFGLHLNVEETQRMLRLGGCSELYARVGRDAVILFAVSRGMGIGETDELLDANGFPSLFGIGTESGRNGKYVCVDYEPPSDIPLRYAANYREISAWVLQEYGLKVTSRHVTQVKRKHGIITQGGQSRPLPEGAEPPKVPPEIEAAIEAALRHFRML